MQAGRVRWHILMYLYSAHASVTHCRRVSPLGREGLAILPLRKLYRQPYFFAEVVVCCYSCSVCHSAGVRRSVSARAACLACEILGAL
jgi:hypothetical protein